MVRSVRKEMTLSIEAVSFPARRPNEERTWRS